MYSNYSLERCSSLVPGESVFNLLMSTRELKFLLLVLFYFIFDYEKLDGDYPLLEILQVNIRKKF